MAAALAQVPVEAAPHAALPLSGHGPETAGHVR